MEQLPEEDEKAFRRLVPEDPTFLPAPNPLLSVMPGPAAFVTDFHACPMVNPPVPPVPHVGGPILTPMNPTVLLAGMPLAGIGSTAQCSGVPPIDTLVLGNPTYLSITPVSGMGAVSSHGGTVPMGNPTYISL